MGRSLAVRLPQPPEEEIASKRIHAGLALYPIGSPFALMISRDRVPINDLRPLATRVKEVKDVSAGTVGQRSIVRGTVFDKLEFQNTEGGKTC